MRGDGFAAPRLAAPGAAAGARRVFVSGERLPEPPVTPDDIETGLALGTVGGAGLARKLFGHFVQAAVSAALQTGRRGPEFGPGIGDETAASPDPSPSETEIPSAEVEEQAAQAEPTTPGQSGDNAQSAENDSEQKRTRRKRRDRGSLLGSEEQEAAARTVGQEIVQELTGRNLAFDDSITDKLSDIAAEKFATTKRNKVLVNLAELGAIVSREQAIKSFVDAQRSGRLAPDGGHEAELSLGLVSESLARSMRERTKGQIDISGFSRTIDGNSVNHAFQFHGPGNERDTSQSPISPEAVSIYLRIVEDPSAEVIVRERPKKGPTTIQYRQRVNGVAVVVEEVRTRSGRVAFKNMWLKNQ